jgi:adenine-specific DNA glycosylase
LNFPGNYRNLFDLKGVGEYTAAAIASFSYNEAVPVVDGNVFQVLSRYFDVETDIAQASKRIRCFGFRTDRITLPPSIRLLWSLVLQCV